MPRAVLEAEQQVAVLGPAAARLVGLAGQQRREQHLLRADRVHLLADDAADVLQHPHAERQPGVDAGRDAADVAGPHEQAVARDLRVRRVLTQRAQEQGGHAEHGRSSRRWGGSAYRRAPARFPTCRVLVLLPPSEGKAPAARRTARPDPLSHPALTPSGSARRALTAAARPTRPACAPLWAARAGEVAKDAVLTTSRTMPALRRYTGVVYEALSYATLSPPARRRARLAAGGERAVRAAVAARPRAGLPAVRRHVAAGRRVARGGLAAGARARARRAPAGRRPAVGPYAALARVPHAVQVRVLREADGVRTVVSHDNKWTKGLLARALCEGGARQRPTSPRPAGRSRTSSRSTGGGRPRAVRAGAAATAADPGGTVAASGTPRTEARAVLRLGWPACCAPADRLAAAAGDRGVVFLSSWAAMALLEPAGSEIAAPANYWWYFVITRRPSATATCSRSRPAAASSGRTSSSVASSR